MRSKRRSVIVNVDDFGLDHETNEAALEAYKAGVIYEYFKDYSISIYCFSFVYCFHIFTS